MMTENSEVPFTVAEELSRLVVGQRRAKAALGRLIDMHMTWFDQPDRLHRAPNALIIGPTGTGKTHAITVVAEALRIPLAVIDSTRLVSVGSNQQISFEEIVIQLVKSARIISQGGNSLTKSAEALAERGIIFLDEFDKLRYSTPSQENAAVQRRLLQFIEGETVFLEMDEKSAPRSIDTHGILFIAAGAFSGIRSKQVTSKRSMATSKTPESGMTIQPQDVHEYGFVHELVARLPIIIPFSRLVEDDLLEIINHEMVSPLKFYEFYFRQYDLDITIPDDTRRLIAHEAFRTSDSLGARGLHQELFPVLNALATETVDLRDPAATGGRESSITITPEIYRRLKSQAFRVE
ncbi:AAA family ATPase [Spirillospora sp. CA-108201]